MSRRFGRQQKRKMRAAMASMADDISMFRQAYEIKRRALSDIELRLQEFLRMLPENSVFKPLRAADHISIEYPFLHVVRGVDYSHLAMPGSDEVRPQQIHHELIPLVHIFATLEQNAEGFAYEIWLRARAPDHEQNRGYVFSISRDSFFRSTQAAKHYLSDHILHQLEHFWPSRRAVEQGSRMRAMP